MTQSSLNLVFVWHMHQPDYRDRQSGDYVMPWTYLHGLKDYTDMAAHFERHPSIKAVVNFVPVLLEQLTDYAAQIARGALRDPLLRLLAHPAPDNLTRAEREHALATCFRANHVHMLEPFPSYRRLRDFQRCSQDLQLPLEYLSGAFFADLATWYHLSWTGESLRREQPWLGALITRGEGFSLAERQRVLALIGTELARLVARYRELLDRAQLELSATPYAHPLAPLLLDFQAARDALPDLPLPQASHYPDGAARLRWHCQQGRAVHTAFFGAAPRGIWPAEGAISGPSLAIFRAHDFHWAASGEAVLANTLQSAGIGYDRTRDLYQPWRDASGLTLVFRDDRLSDLVGFEYAKWDAQDAARHLLGELEAIRERAPPGTTPLVCIALDGENAWEHYPFNAYYFFEALYNLLANHSFIKTTTFSDALAQPEHRTATRELPRVCAGSWVYGTLTTWIGDADKNRAWDLLCEAKRVCDERWPALAPETQREVEDLLSVCEGSDWFWWLGDYNPSASVSDFERLFRQNLQKLYGLLGVPAPGALMQCLSHGSSAAQQSGTMRRASEET